MPPMNSASSIAFFTRSIGSVTVAISRSMSFEMVSFSWMVLVEVVP